MRTKPKSLLRKLEPGDLKMILHWRNSPEVRHYMYNQEKISVDSHNAWFEKNAEDSSKELLVFESEGEPQGFVNISKNGNNIADWGFYTKPNAEKGMGSRLGSCALNYAFEVMQLHKLCGEVIAYNQGSIRFHKKLGFHQEGILRDQYFDGNEYHDVIHFGLLGSEWKEEERVKNG